MLIPLTRNTFDELVPPLATGVQYIYCWGKFSDFLKRLLISVILVAVFWGLNVLIGEDFNLLFFCGGLASGFYWLWIPIYGASLRNIKHRRYRYCGFWQGKVLDVFLTDEVIGKEETVNSRGDLVIVENRERRLNMEVGDDSGFSTQIQVPLRREHKSVRTGQTIEMVLFSFQSDLQKIVQVSDAYIPSQNLWISDYPYLRRDAFIEVSRKLQKKEKDYAR
ncbi:MAG: phosphate ABC transporter permease [Cyanobacteria bacterium WB6_1B_304]|jgi:hypothetical protein|nr:phosphate ABC transporter permease [Cyanobacteria bacterium WB6_1B_304]